MKAKILKNMMVDGRLLQSGDIVDVKGWRHAKALNRNRYILIIEEDEVKPVKAKAPVEPAVEEAAPEKPKAKKSATKTEE